MPQITSPQPQQNILSKLLGIGQVVAGAYGVSTGKFGTSATTAQNMSAAGNATTAASGINSLMNKQNKVQQVSVPQYNPMAEQLKYKTQEAEQILKTLADGEQAINHLGKQYPEIFQEYYQPLASTMFAAYKDPRFSQYRQQQG